MREVRSLSSLQPSLFGTSTAATGGGLFGTGAATSTAFGASAAATGTTIKFDPVVGTDQMMRNNQSTTTSTKAQCITTMKVSLLAILLNCQ